MNKEISPLRFVASGAARRGRAAAASAALLASLLGLANSGQGATYPWNGSSGTALTDGGNYDGGSAPAFTSTDVIAFTGETAPANQPFWAVPGSSASPSLLGGIQAGDFYPLTLTLYAANANRAIDFGATGIDTGSQAAAIAGTMLDTGTVNRNIDLLVNTAQTWTIGSGGLSFVNTANSKGATALVRLAGSGALTKSGSGTLAFSGAGTFNGTLTITEGRVQGAGGNNDNFTGSGASFVLDGTTAVLSQTANLGNRTITVNGGGGTFAADDDGTWKTANQLSGTGDFTLDMTSASGSGLIIQESNATYSGHITVKTSGTGQVVNAQDANAFGDAANSNHRLTVNGNNAGVDGITIANGVNLAIGTLDGNASARIATVSGAANVATLTINQYEAGTYAGVFSRGDSAGGAFHVVKNQSGTLTLTGDSSATWDSGSAEINGGAVVAGANNVFGTSAVNVFLNNATLASDTTGRSLANSVTTSGTASVISPAGTFTLGSLDASNGVTLSLASSELLDIAGLLTGASAPGSFVLDLLGGFDTGSPATILTFDSGLGLDASDFSLSAAASSLYTLQSVSIGANSVEVTLMAVPEPSAWALLAVSLCGGAPFLRRSKSRSVL